MAHEKRPQEFGCGERMRNADSEAPDSSHLAALLADRRAQGADEGARFRDYKEFLAHRARASSIRSTL